MKSDLQNKFNWYGNLFFFFILIKHRILVSWADYLKSKEEGGAKMVEE